MPTPRKKLKLPKGFSLIKAELPRVIEKDGKRYAEELDKNGESFPNACFVAGDGDLETAASLELLAEGEKLRAARAAKNENGLPARADNGFSAELSNAQIENADLHRQVSELQSSNESQADNIVSLQSRVDELQRENTRLAALPERVKFENLELELRAAERNLSLMEGAMGLRGIPVKSVVAATKEVPGGQTIETYADRLANAKTPEEQNNLLNEFQAAVRDGRVKAKAR